MTCTYRLKTGKVMDEELSEHIVYGIEAAAADGKIIMDIPDVSTDFSTANKLVSLCNSENLDSIHLFDVIEDFL